MTIYNNIFIILFFIFILISIFFTIIIKPLYLTVDIDNFKNNNIEKFENNLDNKVSITVQIKNSIDDIEKIWVSNKKMFNGLKTQDEYNKKTLDLLGIIFTFLKKNYGSEFSENENAKISIRNYVNIILERIDDIKNNKVDNSEYKDTVTDNNYNNIIDKYIHSLDNNTLTHYKSGFNFQKILDYKSMSDKYDVNNDEPLLTYMCVKTKLTSTENMYDMQNMIFTLSKNFYVSVIDTYILNTNDIINKISENFDDFLRKSGEFKIECPIYALIYQSPYLRYNGGEIHARYDVVNNLLSSYEHVKDSNVKTPLIGSQPLYAKIIMLYPLYIDYDLNGKIRKLQDNSGLTYFQSYFNDSKMSRDKLCFLKCNKTNKLACGCLNRDTASENDDSYYKSTCLDEKNNKTNYGMMYSINFNYLPFIPKIYMKVTV